MYKYTSVFFCTLCAVKIWVIDKKKMYKNAIQNIEQGVGIFIIFLQNDLVM
jgi:hypothetical protein